MFIMNKERSSRVFRVTSSDAEAKNHFLDRFQQEYEQQQPFPGEKPKHKGQVEILQAINQLMQPFVEEYGGTYLSVTPNHYKLLTHKERMLPKDRMECEKGLQGRVEPYAQFVKLFDPNIDHGNALHFTQVSVHESMHFQSYSQGIYDSKKDLYFPARTGLAIINPRLGKNVTLGETIDEAVAEELKIRFMTQHENKIPYLQPFITLREQAKEAVRPQLGAEVENISYVFIDHDYEGKIIPAGRFDKHGYSPEREMLWEIINTITERGTDGASQEDVFKEFAYGFFSGDLRPVAQRVSTTLGRGTLRKMLEWPTPSYTKT